MYDSSLNSDLPSSRRLFLQNLQSSVHTLHVVTHVVKRVALTPVPTLAGQNRKHMMHRSSEHFTFIYESLSVSLETEKKEHVGLNERDERKISVTNE